MDHLVNYFTDFATVRSPFTDHGFFVSDGPQNWSGKVVVKQFTALSMARLICRERGFTSCTSHTRAVSKKGKCLKDNYVQRMPSARMILLYLIYEKTKFLGCHSESAVTFGPGWVSNTIL